MTTHDTAADTGTALHDEVGPPLLERPLHPRMIAGVAAGVARYLDIDPVLVRIALVVLTCFGGVGVLLYAAGWVLIPEEGTQASMSEQWLDRLQEHRS